MPRVRHVAAPSPYRSRSLGTSTVGDEHTVDDATAAYLCDERGNFERVDDEIVLSEDEYEVVGDEGDAPPQGLDALTKEELYERAQEADIAGRSEMSKDELIEALRED